MKLYPNAYLKNVKENVNKIINKYKGYDYYFGVVKADCYGHGYKKTVQAVIDGGCNYLAVATLEEAIKIRAVYTKIPILCLGVIDEEFLKICEENSIYYSIYTQNSIIAKTLNYNVLFYHQENASKPDGKKTNICITEDIYQYVLNRKETDYTKITICDDNNIIFNSIIKKLREVKGIDVLDVGHMSRKLMKLGTEIHSIEYFYTEITNENANKWNALEFLIQKLGIEKEEVIAIGDNVNDQTMLENAGLGVAMANSAPYIQQMANIVTESNNEDGIAKVIEKYILE